MLGPIHVHRLPPGSQVKEAESLQVQWADGTLTVIYIRMPEGTELDGHKQTWKARLRELVAVSGRSPEMSEDAHPAARPLRRDEGAREPEGRLMPNIFVPEISVAEKILRAP